MNTDRGGNRWDFRWDRWDSRSGRSTLSGIVVGALIVAVGVSLLLDNMGILRIHDIWRFWPVIFIAYGVSRLLECRTPAGYVWGGLMTLVGSLLLLDSLHILRFDFELTDLIWPMIIIGFGVSLLLRTLDRRSSAAAGVPRGTTVNPDVNIWAIFSGFKRRIDAQDFKGGDIVALFGGVHLDLRHAAISGDRASIDVNAMFGGIDIRVPENWLVTMKGVGIFGAFEDKTIRPRPDPNVKSPELVITGTGVFAGIKADN
jgi:predicted membrane protein